MGLGIKDLGLAVELLRGMGITFREMLKPPVTVQYPTQRRQQSEAYRGLLRWDANKCVACVLCEYYCPVKAINIITAEGPDGKKTVLDYRLDAAHCMTCGLCVEICPVRALSHSPDFELAAFEREEVVFHNEKMSGPPEIKKYR